MKNNKRDSGQILAELIEKAKEDSSKREILVDGYKEVFSEMAVDDSVKEFIRYKDKNYSLDKLISLLDMIKAGILKVKVGEILPEALNNLHTAYSDRNFINDFVYIGYVYPYMTSQYDDENDIKAPMLYIKSTKTKKIVEIEFIKPNKGKKIENDNYKVNRTLECINNTIKLNTRNSDDFVMTLEEVKGDDDTFYSGMSLKEYPDGFNDEKFGDIIVRLTSVLRLVENLERCVEGLEVSRISHNGHITKYISREIYGSFVIELNGRENVGISEDDNGDLRLETISDFVIHVDEDGYPKAKRISVGFSKLLEKSPEMREVFKDNWFSFKSIYHINACIEGIKEFRKMRTEIELGE